MSEDKPASRGITNGFTCVNRSSGKYSMVLLTRAEGDTFDHQHHKVKKVEAKYPGVAAKVLWIADAKLHAHGAKKKHAKIFLKGEDPTPLRSDRGDEPFSGTLTITLESDGTAGTPPVPVVEDVPVVFVDEPNPPC